MLLLKNDRDEERMKKKKINKKNEHDEFICAYRCRNVNLFTKHKNHSAITFPTLITIGILNSHIIYEEKKIENITHLVYALKSK